MSNTYNFKWTDELVKECIEYSKENYGKGFPTYDAVIGFKNSKTGGAIGSVKDIDISVSHTIKEGDIFNNQRVTSVRPILNGVQFQTIEIKEQKPILFTTEERKDINESYSGLRFSVVFHDFSYNFNESIHQTLDEIKLFGRDRLKIFTTKEAAEEYILNNKPVLSYNDIKGIDHARNGDVMCIKVNKIKSLIQEKIKQ